MLVVRVSLLIFLKNANGSLVRQNLLELRVAKENNAQQVEVVTSPLKEKVDSESRLLNKIKS